MGKLLILYASKGGSTTEVIHFIADIFKDNQIDFDLYDADQFRESLEIYDGVLLGAPIYKGLWMTSLWRAVRRLEDQFKDKPIWGFSLCLRVLETNGQDYAKKNYLPHHILSTFNVQDYRFFAGRVDNLTLSDRQELYDTYDGQLGKREGDFRDWDAIREWAMSVVKARVSVKT